MNNQQPEWMHSHRSNEYSKVCQMCQLLCAACFTFIFNDERAEYIHSIEGEVFVSIIDTHHTRYRPLCRFVGDKCTEKVVCEMASELHCNGEKLKSEPTK